MHLQERMRLLPMIAAALFGALSAVGGYTFIYAKGFSYLGHDAAACANCHVMQNHYGAWLKSSHRSVAVCNDCHTPPGVIPKYFTKALNGFNHSLAFTTGRFPKRSPRRRAAIATSPWSLRSRGRILRRTGCRASVATRRSDIWSELNDG